MNTSLPLCHPDQLRTDLAAIESDLEFFMRRINRLPTASDLCRAGVLIALVAAVLGIVGIEAFWRYFPCGAMRVTRKPRRSSPPSKPGDR
jgi:hypothetical protein